jgi:predicted transcriptional regulator
MGSSRETARAVAARVAKERLDPTVRRLAAERGMSLSELARSVGYDGVNGLLEVITGASDVKLSRLLDIASQLRVWSLEELFGPSGTSAAIEVLGTDPARKSG